MRKLAIFSFSFAAAVAAYLWVLPRTAAVVCALLLLPLGVFLRFRSSLWAKRCRIAALALAFGLLWSFAYELLNIRPMKQYCGENVSVTAEVSGYPEETDYGCRVQTKLDGNTMLLYLDADGLTLRPGDVVTLEAEVIDASILNESYLANDVSLLAFQTSEAEVDRAASVPLKYLPVQFAETFQTHIRRLFPDDTEGFVLALLTGDKSGLSYRLTTQLSTVGLSHVMAVSGLHISLLVGLIMTVFRRKRFAAFLCIGAVVFFAAMLGFPPSVVRAMLMNIVLLMAPIFRRENDPPTSMGLALMVALLLNPWALASLSLQLSYLAVAGIMLFTEKITAWQERHFSVRETGRITRLLGRLLRWAQKTVAVTLGASVLTVPLALIRFGSTSLIAPIANLLVLWMISYVFFLTFPILLLGVIPPVGTALAWVLSWLIRLIVRLIGLLSSVPFAAMYDENAYFLAWLLAAYAMFALFLLCKRRKVWPLVASVVSTLLCALILTLLDQPSGSFTMFDVGQGQCLLLQSGDFTVMIDCGGDSGDENGERVARSLLSSGQTQLDALILTHYDEDHTCGIEQFFSRIEVQYLFIPDISDDSGRRAEIVALAENYGTTVCYVTEDMTLSSDGASVQVIPPTGDGEANDGLCVLLSFGSCDILVTGDMDIEAEYRLVAEYDLPDLDILVAGHHGSKYATSSLLLRNTTPEVVLISVGENSYGHPTQETLARIEAVSATVYRTDLCGDITITR